MKAERCINLWVGRELRGSLLLCLFSRIVVLGFRLRACDLASQELAQLMGPGMGSRRKWVGTPTFVQLLHQRTYLARPIIIKLSGFTAG